MSSGDGDDDKDTAYGHRMAFSTDNDFKGGRWVNGEFYYEEKREGKTQSKHEATYGVFDNDSSGSDYGGSSGDDDFHGRSRHKKQKNNKNNKKKGISNKPLLFIAKENSPPDEEDSLSADANNVSHDNKEEKKDDDDLAKDEFQKIINSVKQENKSTSNSNPSTTGPGAGAGASNTDFRDMLDKANIPKPTYKPPPLTSKQTDMQWEKSSKGFGKKYLSKFGFNGRLGAKETGVSGVIEVKVRPNQMGLGFGNFTEQSALESNRKLDAEVRGKDYVPLQKNITKDNKKKSQGKVSHGLVEDRAASKAWKLGGVSLKDTADSSSKSKSHEEKQAAMKAKRQKKGGGGVSFGGVFGDSHMHADSTAASATTKQVILDMRGAIPKHITDTSTINHHGPNEGGVSDSDSAAPPPKLGQELLYNLNVIVDMDELHLQTSQSRLESLQNRMDAIAIDQEALSKQASRDKSQLTALQSIQTILERIDAALCTRPLEINKEDIFRAFRKVCVYYPEETKLLGLIDMIPTLARPLLEHELHTWSPRDHPSLLVELYVDWMSGIAAFEEEVNAQDVPVSTTSTTTSTTTDSAYGGGNGYVEVGGAAGAGAATSTAYQCLGLVIEQICLPVLRRYLVNEWTVKDIAETLSCSSLLKHVKGIFLKESFITLVEMTVLPKIATTVKYWNPTVDRTPIHEWVLPWVRVIGRSISTVFPEIRRKLASALSQWNPLDSSAFYTLHPWAGVFDAKSFNDFLQRNIIPKLLSAIQAQSVEPSGQDMSRLTAVLLWHPLLSRDDMVNLLEGEFFPKWFLVLAAWLETPAVDFEEVSTWYSTWRGVMPEAILAEPIIAHYFQEALEMMSVALSRASSSSSSSSSSSYSIPPALTQGNDYFKLVNKRKNHQLAMQKLETLNNDKSSRYHHHHHSNSSAHSAVPGGGGGGRHSVNSSSSSSNTSSSFKEVIEDFALQHNMSFLPKRASNGAGASLSEDGIPLWVFNDRVTCYVDQNVLYARVEEESEASSSRGHGMGGGGSQKGRRRVEKSWQPIDLDTLLRMA